MAGSGPIELATLSGDFAGDALAIYPQSVFISDVSFQFDVWIVQIHLSTSLVVFPGVNSNKGGLFVTIDQTQNRQLAVGEGLKSVAAHIIDANSIPGGTPIANPSSKISPVMFGGCGYLLKNRSPISLWGIGEATAGNSLWAIASIQYRRVVPGVA